MQICCSKEARRTVLWMCWVVNMIITSIYYILSFITTHNLLKSYKLLNISISNQIWRAPVAAAVLGGVLVLLFNLLSCAILVCKSIDRRGPGMGYGFVVAMCFMLAFFVLLCGLVLDGFREVVASELQAKLPDAWSKYNTGEYVGTIAFAYICFVMFAVFFLCLVVFQSAVSEELGIAGVQAPGPAPYAQMAELPYPPAPYGGSVGLMKAPLPAAPPAAAV